MVARKRKHMNERKQLTARAPFLTRKLKVSGGLAAMTLGDVQEPVKTARKFASRICQREHRWHNSRHTKRCLRCGLEEAR